MQYCLCMYVCIRGNGSMAPGCVSSVVPSGGLYSYSYSYSRPADHLEMFLQRT